MNMRALLEQFSNSSPVESAGGQGVSNAVGNLTNQLPSGLAGGAVAGGIMALIMSNKSARKVAGTAATYGGAAFLGGLAYKAYKNWQSGQHEEAIIPAKSFTSAEVLSPDYQLTLIKGMIGAAQADGHIDAEEQRRIFQSINKMSLSSEVKATVLDLLGQPVSIEEIVKGAQTLEQKTELYLVSCMIIDSDQQSEKNWLTNLSQAMGLPADLAAQLQFQANNA